MSVRLGLVGYPVEHSISPALHKAGLAALKIDGEYLRYPVAKLPDGMDEFTRLLSLLKAGSLNGLNVTIPHKQTIIQWLDILTPTAGLIGAVNTLYCCEAKLVGDNTDAQGFLMDLQRVFGGQIWRVGGLLQESNTALILGAGGSARAVAYALNQAGWKLAIAARNPIKAKEIKTSLRLDNSTTVELSNSGLRDFITACDPAIGLVVNTTPLGMFPKVEESPWPEEIPLPRETLIYDLVYNPRTTRFVRNARQAGHASANGLGMLVEQAALALELWTGKDVPREPMHHAAELAIDPI